MGTAALAGMLVLAACSGSGDEAPAPSPSSSPTATSDEFRPKLEPFTELALTAPYDLRIVEGSEPSLVIVAPPDIQQGIAVSVEDGVLTLGFKVVLQSGALPATLTVPADQLTSLDIGGAAAVESEERLTGGSLTVTLRAASSTTLPMSVDALQLTADAASKAVLTGEADDVTVSASGASSVDMSRFAAAAADVTASGASTVRIGVTGPLVADATGASTIRYSGSPTSVESNADLASTIEAQ